MTAEPADRLYALLPAVQRLRDGEAGSPLRALLRIAERQHQALEDDIARLRDDWFIETCDEWVVPYIGDLLAAGALHDQGGGRRAFVANTIAYRRRKGTAAMLEQLARDLTGAPARAVEYMRLIAVNQHVAHPVPDRHAVPDLRDTRALELLDGPLERTARTVEVRSIAAGRGRYRPGNVGLFVSRVESYPVEGATARAVSDPPDGRYTFDPLGRSLPLYNWPLPEPAIAHLAEEENLALPLRRRPLYDELEQRRAGTWAGGTGWFRRRSEGSSDEASVLEVRLGAADPLEPEVIAICDLSGTTDWRRPPAGTAVAVDPVLGRLSLPAGAATTDVRVSYSYGAGADLGGGPYDRRGSVEAWLRPGDGQPLWQAGVTQDPALLAAGTPAQPLFGTLGQAVAAFNARLAAGAAPFGLIAILDSATYEEPLTGPAQLAVPAGGTLALVAAAWPLLEGADPVAAPERVPGLIEPGGLRPHVRGNVSIKGETGGAPGTVVLDGLLVEGSVTVLVGDLGTLRVAHCTLSGGPLTVNASKAGPSNDRLEVVLDRALCPGVELAAGVPALIATDSVLRRAAAIVAPGARVELDGVTVLGTTAVRELSASDCVFDGKVDAERRQTGCVRYSFVPPGSRTPRRYRCQPELAGYDTLRPVFASETPGDALYARLAAGAPRELRAGASDEGEMGAFNFIHETQREANLRSSLREYLRLGLEAGVLHAEGEPA